MLYWIKIWRLPEFSEPFGFTELTVTLKTPAWPLWLERDVRGRQPYSGEAVWFEHCSIYTWEKKLYPPTIWRHITSSILDHWHEAESIFSCYYKLLQITAGDVTQQSRTGFSNFGERVW